MSTLTVLGILRGSALVDEHKEEAQSFLSLITSLFNRRSSHDLDVEVSVQLPDNRKICIQIPERGLNNHYRGFKVLIYPAVPPNEVWDGHRYIDIPHAGRIDTETVYKALPGILEQFLEQFPWLAEELTFFQNVAD